MKVRLFRWIRHRWLDDAAHRLPRGIVERLAEGIRLSEQSHDAQISLHIESSLPTAYLWRDQLTPALLQMRAKELFASKGVWDTEGNNGVLIYVCLAERTVELVFDRAVQHAIPPDQWKSMLSRMTQHVRTSHLEGGLVGLLGAMSALLAAHFPATDEGVLRNEISDTPTLR